MARLAVREGIHRHLVLPGSLRPDTNPHLRVAISRVVAGPAPEWVLFHLVPALAKPYKRQIAVRSRANWRLKHLRFVVLVNRTPRIKLLQQAHQAPEPPGRYISFVYHNVANVIVVQA